MAELLGSYPGARQEPSSLHTIGTRVTTDKNPKKKPDRSAADEKRRLRQVAGHREAESRWLQKATFALGKARDARAKLSDATGQDLSPLVTLEGGEQLSIDDLGAIVQTRVDELNGILGRGSYVKRR